MKKLLLVNPVGRKSGLLLSRFSTFQPLGLAYVAAVTPPHWDVKIVDENFGQQPLEDADLVGLTAFTSSINRAYELARLYRGRGVKVVIGGIHASMLPEEALEHADAVVAGEAEEIWPRVIADFEAGRMSGIYNGPRVDLSRSTVKPRRDLLNPSYFFQSVQTSRGCPFSCSFCSVSRYLGTAYRQREPGEVLDEVAGIPGRWIFFMDDNLVGYTPESRARAKALFRGLIGRGLRKRWWMQTSINTADDEELLSLASRSGCMYAFIGFESVSEDSLKEMKKGINVRIGVENYARVIRAFHRHGIGVVGSFMVGSDHESVLYYKKLARFMVKAGVDMVQVSMLTPLPGTAFMETLRQENRLLYTSFPEDWDKYRLSWVVRKPVGVDPQTIYFGNNYVKRHVYSFPVFQYRMLKSLLSVKRPLRVAIIRRYNKSLKKAWQGSHYYREDPSAWLSGSGRGD
jgi:radical SAM superfamily enzyme YgiQ (UPF0313 family)